MVLECNEKVILFYFYCTEIRFLFLIKINPTCKRIYNVSNTTNFCYVSYYYLGQHFSALTVQAFLRYRSLFNHTF